MFWYDETREGGAQPGHRVRVAFTDSTLDLHGDHPAFPATLARLEDYAGLHFARLNQVHGAAVHVVTADPGAGPRDDVPEADAMVTDRRGVGLMVRAGDCVPVVLADVDAGVIGAVHAGRSGMALDVATRTVDDMRRLGADEIVAWVGPHVCGRCYEVPEEMRAAVASRVPASYATTDRGTPALDIGAGVRAQLEEVCAEIVDVGGCTVEDDRLHSYRRDGAAAGRLAALVWMP